MKILMSEKTSDVIKALALVKSEITGVAKKSKNPYFKSNYADLNEHLDVVEPVLHSHGLMLLQPTYSDSEGNYLSTMIIHVSTGQYFSSTIKLPNLPDPQKLIASITYMRRASINTLLSLKSLDDDGESIVRGEKKTNNKFKPKFRAKQTNDDDF